MKGLHLCLEARDVEGLPRDLMVHPRTGFRKIGEADAQLEQRGELARLMPPRGDPDLVQGAPEAVARMGVVVSDRGRACAGRRADEDEAQVRAELVGEAMEAVIGHLDQWPATSGRYTKSRALARPSFSDGCPGPARARRA